MKTAKKQIHTIEELRALLVQHKDTFLDFGISINAENSERYIFSRKEIRLSETPTGRERFQIHNCIDGTMQFLSAKQLMDFGYTNIAYAMEIGSFYQLIY